MSVSTMVETYDMPMTDYNEDGDIPMAGSSENWLQPLPQMDEDAHHIGPFSDSQEVDMIAFEETTTEYEMADEAVQPQDADIDANVLDAEVYDATIHASPLPTEQPEIVGHHDEHSGLLEVDGSIIGQLQSEGEPHVTVTRNDSSAGQHFPAPDTIPTHDALHLSGDVHDSGSASASHAADNEFGCHTERKEQEQNEEPTAAPVPPTEEVANTVETYSSAHSERGTNSLRNEKSEDGEAEGGPPDPSAADDPSQTNEDAREVVDERTINGEVLQALKVVEESAEGAAVNAEESGAEHSELPTNSQVYLHPPPPIQLSLQVTSAEGDQPEFVLFSLPESSSHVTEEPLVLLQHNPSLFYEPVSAVFDAFRQEEYFSHIDELSEAEMALNAHELQLVISEDNIYSREVSLQDLYAMHQGVGLAGHLRLTLQSNVPRFITRYNHLRDQITRLVLGDEVEDSRQHAEYTVTVTEEEGHETPGQETRPLVSLDEPREGSDHDDASAEPEADQGNEDGELHVNGREIEESNEIIFHGVTDDLLEGDEQDQDEVSEHDDDASGESDDAAYDLDADATNVEAVEDGAELSANEYDTEYAHEAGSHEESNEDHNNDFGEDRAEGTGTIGDTAELIAFPDDEKTELFATEERQESAQLEKISQSTSTTSFGADESSWEDVGEEDGGPQGLEEETNQSIQRTTATIFDEEGNLADEIEEVGDHDLGDDDSGEGDFDDSTASTLEDPSEEDGEIIQNRTAAGEAEKDTDASSRALLAESENFVSKLVDDSTTIEVIKGTTSDDDVRKESLSPSTVITAAASKARVIDKNAPKRSLDIADLDDEEIYSLSSSPDSKRTRMR